MKKLIIASGLVLATVSGAFAQSSALDVQDQVPTVTRSADIDYTATAAIGAGQTVTQNPRLGDGAPRVVIGQVGDRDIDYTATASIGAHSMPLGPRLGDGSPV